jgi:hypothetical protein
MECGSWCGYYDSKAPDETCKDCRASARNAEMFELARKLAVKREDDRRIEFPDCRIVQFADNMPCSIIK